MPDSSSCAEVAGRKVRVACLNTSSILMRAPFLDLKYNGVDVSATAPIGLIYRCSGPNCGKLRQGNEDGWWLLWTSMEHGIPVLSLSPWDENDCRLAGRLYAC